MQLTERDTFALGWIADQYYICFDQLQRLLVPEGAGPMEELSVAETRSIIEQWIDQGYVDEPRKAIQEQFPAIWLSREGLRKLDIDYPYYRPDSEAAAHIYAVNSVRLFITKLLANVTWTSERSLRRQTTTRPLPDAELDRQQEHVAIKVLERPVIASSFTAEVLPEIQTLAGRRDEAQNAYEYDQVWCFVRQDSLPIMQEIIARLEPSTQQRLVLYGLGRAS